MIAVEWFDIEGITKMQYSFKEDTLKPVCYLLGILALICIFTGKSELILLIPIFIIYGLLSIWPFVLFFCFICWLAYRSNNTKPTRSCKGLHNPYIWVQICGRGPNGNLHIEHWCPICRQRIT